MEFDTAERKVVRGEGNGVAIAGNTGVAVDSRGRIYALESSRNATLLVESTEEQTTRLLEVGNRVYATSAAGIAAGARVGRSACVPHATAIGRGGRAAPSHVGGTAAGERNGGEHN